MLRVHSLEAHYGSLHVLKAVELEVSDGAFVTVIGANGAGKTTLLHTISGLVKKVSGVIEYDGQNLLGMDTSKIVKLGIVQIPEGREVFPFMSVKDNLEMGTYVRKDRVEKRADLDKMYELFPILRKRWRQYAGTLSGGEQQMLAIARGVMSKPKLLILDEPSLGLSPVLVETVFDAIRRIHESGIAVLLVEQNANLALQVAETGYVLELGKIVLNGSTQALATSEEVRRSYLGL